MRWLLHLLFRASAMLSAPGPDTNDMDDKLHKTRKRRKEAYAATQRAEDSLSRVRLIIETAGGAAEVVDRWRR